MILPRLWRFLALSLCAFAFCLPLATTFVVRVFHSCMVHIKFTAHPQTPVVSPKFASMASDEAAEVSTEQRETSIEQPEESLAGRQMVALSEAASEQDVESDYESQSSDSSYNKTASDNSGHVKVVAIATLARISYDFGQ
jgi:hypothetical protein